MLFPILFFILLGCCTSWTVIQLFVLAKVGRPEQDVVQHHHTHTGIIPRIGGLGIISGFAAVYLLCFFLRDASDNHSLIHYAVFGGAVATFMLGLWDDFWPLGARVKLLSQVIIALVAHQCGLSIEGFRIPFTEVTMNLGPLSMLLTVFWFVAIMNLINLIDGLDGLAGGIGCMLMLMLAYLAISKGAMIPSILALGMIGALLGFLFHNFPPAKVYMGDSGAYTIGYVIAALSLLNAEKGAVLAALLGPSLALALPIADVSYAILRRSLQGLPLFRADRGHIHHHLMRGGLDHTKTVLVLYGLSLLALFAGLLLFIQRGRHLPILLGACFFLILIFVRRKKVSIAAAKDQLIEVIESRPDTQKAILLKNRFVQQVDATPTGEDFWTQYQDMLKAFGFCQAALTWGEARRAFTETAEVSPAATGVRELTLPLRGATPGELVLSINRTNCSVRRFHLLADIALEAWSQGSARWKVVHGEALAFSGGEGSTQSG
jgi:UDP-GlcNAc:undecaprenyl-phosphate GlcNAc-1-phosphate transferase